ncbi:WAP four-disulfide core domain protein 3-like [Equus przewalskii]|uniref:WAP four-disulfide core domain protein 3-like n=1 Tax=Equus przewalskii TaxID=9798 RepID=A0ABM4JLY1_EQUPR
MKLGGLLLLVSLITLSLEVQGLQAEVRPVQDVGICVDRCRGDLDCGAGQRCLRRGCRRTCAPALGPVIGICVEECQRHRDCGVGRLCVSNGCGHVCQPARDQDGSRRGSCPRLPPGTIGTCVELCSGDESCPRGQKCCSHGCGRSCQTAVPDEEDFLIRLDD